MNALDALQQKLIGIREIQKLANQKVQYKLLYDSKFARNLLNCYYLQLILCILKVKLIFISKSSQKNVPSHPHNHLVSF